MTWHNETNHKRVQSAAIGESASLEMYLKQTERVGFAQALKYETSHYRENSIRRAEWMSIDKDDDVNLHCQSKLQDTERLDSLLAARGAIG